MQRILLLFLFLVQLLPAQSLHNGQPFYLTGIEYTLQVTGSDSVQVQEFTLYDSRDRTVQSFKFDTVSAGYSLPVTFPHPGNYKLKSGQRILSKVRIIPGWLSIIPPLLAIFLALLLRQVLVALFAGIWIGATIIFNYNPFSGFFLSLSEYIGRAIADPERASILIFSLALGGMVGVISKSGGTLGIVEKLSQFASNRKRGQLVTWFLGLLVFFDDYANTLIVGNTMRPLTDRLKISREKLSYLVDSTAAPVANLAVISTWIGYELGLISDSLQHLGLSYNSYVIFFQTIPFNFYPILTLVLGLVIALSGRDFGAMYKAEKRAVDEGQVIRPGAVPLADLNSKELSAAEGVPLRWYNALIPILMVIFTTLAGLWITGWQSTDFLAMNFDSMTLLQKISTVIGNADSFAVLMWSSFSGGLAAILLAAGQKILKLEEALEAWVSGIKAMVMAALILTMAWSIGNICHDLQTAEYVIAATKGILSAHWLPVLTFTTAAVISFSTGTSWGTMAILTPIVIPLAYQLPLSDTAISQSGAWTIFISSIAAILAGSPFGDHCSPISDTTIMSSMASGSDHIDHVRTQLPYALFAALLSVVTGYIPAGYGLPGYISLLAGTAVMILLLWWRGRKV